MTLRIGLDARTLLVDQPTGVERVVWHLVDSLSRVAPADQTWVFFVDRPIVHCNRPLGTYQLHSRGQSVESSPLSRHYQEFDHILGRILDRFAEHLSPLQFAELLARREEAKKLHVEWAAKESSKE